MKAGKTSRALLTVVEIVVLFVVIFAGLFVLMKTIGGGLRKEKQTTGTRVDATPVELSKAPTPEERDLNGLEVSIVTWWDMDWDNPQDDYEKAFREAQNEAMKKYNYTLTNKIQDGWWSLEYPEEFLLGVYDNRPIGSIVCLDNRWVGQLMETGALLDVSKLPSVDWSDRKYNQTVIEMMSFNGAIYGFASGMEPRAGVFFNKDILAAAGLSPDLPYDLQASGKWNFANFKELCAKLTRDVDNDGLTDIYGVSSYYAIAVPALLAANGTSVIVKDETGGLKLNADDKRVTEVLDFLHDDLIGEGYYRMEEEGETWDFFKQCFADGEVAMLIDEQYMSEQFVNIWNPSLELGFVTIPMGPSTDDYTAVCRENILVMPNCEAIRSVADDIAFVYDIYTDAPKGMEEDDRRWKRCIDQADSLDARAVNETCNWIINKWDSYMPYIDTYLPVEDSMWAYYICEGMDPKEILEGNADNWREQVERFNSSLKKTAE
ncbi:MAG: extracellular solute-binding protein [Lachnospiraceae bacterium]|nr:extracellular solute-binding protein [Lachnospiraceae bacterium]